MANNIHPFTGKVAVLAKTINNATISIGGHDFMRRGDKAWPGSDRFQKALYSQDYKTKEFKLIGHHTENKAELNGGTKKYLLLNVSEADVAEADRNLKAGGYMTLSEYRELQAKQVQVKQESDLDLDELPETVDAVTVVEAAPEAAPADPAEKPEAKAAPKGRGRGRGRAPKKAE